MSYGREIKYMRKQFEKARLNMIFAQSHDNTPQEQIVNLSEKLDIIETILEALKIASHVRCMDCKHIMFSDCYGVCGAGHLGIVRPDDFCSRGERKEGADNG